MIRSVEYHDDDHSLDIEFTSGRIYRYWLITSATYEGLLSAPSIGQHFNVEIRDRFPCRELK